MKTPTNEGCANLFTVAKRLLQERVTAAGEGKVRDNDVGARLGLDPSDTSNWKKGKRVITKFSQYLRLASATGASVEDLYSVAACQKDPNTVVAVQTPVDVLVPEVAPLGSVLLFFYTKDKLTETNEKTTDGDVGKIFNFVPTETTRWKRGSRLINRIDQFMKLAEVNGVSPLYLYQIASGNIPESLEKYVFRAEKSIKTKKNSKSKSEKVDQSA